MIVCSVTVYNNYMPMYRHVDKDFFKKWTLEMAYVLGFFMADGSIDINPRGSHYFSLAIIDRKLLESIHKSLKSTHKISVIKRANKSNWSDQYRLQIGSREMCDDLRRLGVTENKTNNLLIPEIPKKFFSHFVRGYFDGDGNVWIGKIHKRRKIQTYAIHTVFTSCSGDFLKDLKSKLEYLGLKGGSFCKADNAYRLQYSINNSIMLYNIMYSGKYSLFLER